MSFDFLFNVVVGFLFNNVLIIDVGIVLIGDGFELGGDLIVDFFDGSFLIGLGEFFVGGNVVIEVSDGIFIMNDV